MIAELRYLNPKQVEQIQSAVNKIQSSVQKIEAYLYDDEFTDSPGVVKQVRDHGKRISNLEQASTKNTKFLKWLAISAGTVTMLIFEFLRWLFNNHKP